jgi:hypothetical protein
VRDRGRAGQPARLDADASSISYIAGWSHADRTVLTQAATNVLHAVNTIRAGIGLDDDTEDDESEEIAGVA